MFFTCRKLLLGLPLPLIVLSTLLNELNVLACPYYLLFP